MTDLTYRDSQLRRFGIVSVKDVSHGRYLTFTDITLRKNQPSLCTELVRHGKSVANQETSSHIIVTLFPQDHFMGFNASDPFDASHKIDIICQG